MKYDAAKKLHGSGRFRLTQRAPDAGESARLNEQNLHSGFFLYNEHCPRPPTSG
jgi:hypothetical protein